MQANSEEALSIPKYSIDGEQSHETTQIIDSDSFIVTR